MKVFEGGQMTLPVAARHRWGLAKGGQVGFLDLGDAVVLIPAGVTHLQRELYGLVSDGDWDRAPSGFGDDDLANE
jgi:bifunctional DNA-binding transcriptional regulator/antitoxin component of YhaV-PrlF toxin-antitoxin module